MLPLISHLRKNQSSVKKNHFKRNRNLRAIEVIASLSSSQVLLRSQMYVAYKCIGHGFYKIIPAMEELELKRVESSSVSAPDPVVIVGKEVNNDDNGPVRY